MISIRLFQAASLALLAGMLAAGTASAHMPSAPSVSVRPPSVPSVRPPTTTIRPSEFVNSGRSGGNAKSSNGNTSSQKRPTKPPEPEFWTMGEWHQSANAQKVQAQQNVVDQALNVLNAAAAEMKKATLDENKAAWAKARDKWEDAFSKFSKEQQALNVLKERVAANPHQYNPAPGEASPWDPTVVEMMGFTATLYKN